jgi:hypothetical protein
MLQIYFAEYKEESLYNQCDNCHNKEWRLKEPRHCQQAGGASNKKNRPYPSWMQGPAAQTEERTAHHE